MSWYKITLTPEQIANKEKERVMQNFLSLYMIALAPKDMALIANGKEFEIYLSPGSLPYSQKLVEDYHAVSSEKPTGKIALLVGHRDVLASFL